MAHDAPSNEDIVTALQTCLDQLATQFYASLKYSTTHHPLSAPSELSRAVIDPSSLPQPGSAAATSGTPAASANAHPTPGSPPNTTAAAAHPDVPPASPTHRPIDAGAFAQDQRELAVDLVLKQREIEALIARLPRDLGADAVRQEARIRELEGEVRAVEEEVKGVAERREGVLERVEGVIGRYRRV